MANYLPLEKRKQIFHLLCEGSGVRAITRLVHCSTNTIALLQERYSSIIEYLNRKYIKELDIEEIEADELRIYVQKKTNIRWVYVALDRNSRLVIHFHIGKRDAKDAKIFLAGLSRKLSNKSDVATDRLLSYVAAVQKNPYGRFDSETSNVFVLRSKDPMLDRVITNRIETHNGNIRQHVSKLSRRSRCNAKSEKSLIQHLTLYFFYYNFIKKHKSIKTCPAVAASIIESPFSFDQILAYDLLFTEQYKSNGEDRRISRKKKDAIINDMKDKLSGVNFFEDGGAKVVSIGRTA